MHDEQAGTHRVSPLICSSRWVLQLCSSSPPCCLQVNAVTVQWGAHTARGDQLHVRHKSWSYILVVWWYKYMAKLFKLQIQHSCEQGHIWSCNTPKFDANRFPQILLIIRLVLCLIISQAQAKVESWSIYDVDKKQAEGWSRSRGRQLDLQTGQDKNQNNL